MIDTQVAGSHRTRVSSVLVPSLLALAAAAMVVRCVSIAQPLGIDQGLWASAVRGMARGQRLYVDVWEQRPPGIYWTYLAGFQVFGWISATVAWLDVLASAATAVLLFALVRPLSTALPAAATTALYTVLTMPAWLYGHSGFLERSVSETFIVVCVCLSVWCAVAYRRSRSLVLAAGVGLFAGAAVVFKPNAGLYFPAVLLWMMLYAAEAPGGRLRSLRAPFVIATVATLVLPAIAIAWLWQIGALHEAKVAVVDFNRYYVGQGFAPAGYAVLFSKAVWLRMKTEALWLGGGVGALVVMWHLAREGRLPPVAGLAVIWGGAAALVIVVNGARLFNSYFIQAFPPLAVLTAWFLAEWPRNSRRRAAVAAVTASLMMGVLIQRDYVGRVLTAARADLDALRGRTDRVTYLERFGSYANRRGYSARANAELAEYVRTHTAPDDRIFLFGINGAEVYFAADRLTAHRFLRVNFFVETDFPDPRFRLEAVIRELAANKPAYLIFERLHSTSAMGRAADSLPEEPAVLELLSAYRPEAQVEDFSVYRLLN